MKELTDYVKGYVNGQRKIANYILGLTLETPSDYQRLLEHLSACGRGEEVIDNDIIGFYKPNFK